MNALEPIEAALRLSHGWTLEVASELSSSPMAPAEPAGNHPLWVVGHLACSRAGLLAMIDGRPSSLAGWDRLFAGGTTPSEDASRYPAYAEVLAAFEGLQPRTLELLASCGEAGLDRAPAAVPAELRDDPDFASVGRLFTFLALHEMSHRGELAAARRAARLSR